MEEKRLPAWLVYERCVTAFESEEHSDLATLVQPNVHLKGSISGESRQIDVLIDQRHKGGAENRIIVDAKMRSRPVDISDVESFEGLMKDCRACRGILVCTEGWTRGALRRAEDAISITLLTYDQALDYEWAYDACLGPCSSAKRRRKGIGGKTNGRGGVLWGEFLLEGYGPWWVIVQVGKCDGCHSFHVWCWDCGMRFAVPDKKVVQCCCAEREWGSIPESAESGHEGEPESIWLMMRIKGGQPIPFDRRPIR
jgi:hypothetical protein